MTEFEQDCISCWGRVLTGKYAHFCNDWDYLPIDETCHPFAYCNCDYIEWDTTEKNRIKEEVEKEMLKGMV